MVDADDIRETARSAREGARRSAKKLDTGDLHKVGQASKQSVRASQFARELRNVIRDIGEIPEPADCARRENCRFSYQLFCETYFPNRFYLRWSPAQLNTLKVMERAVLEGGGKFAMAEPRGGGKALALDTPIPTPGGWRTMGALQVGETVYDERGRECSITFATPIQYDRQCFRVTFDDGNTVVCDAEHLWTVSDRLNNGKTITIETRKMFARFDMGKRGYVEARYSVPLTAPVERERSTLALDPYCLGVWLGDGTSAKPEFTCHVEDYPEYATLFCARGHATATIKHPSQKSENTRTVKLGAGFGRALRGMALIGSKHIPAAYLNASIPQRLELLRGLMDTDGCIDKRGKCEFVTASAELRDGFAELLAGLGIKFGVPSVKFVEVNGRACGPYYRFSFTVAPTLQVFHLQRKVLRQVNGRKKYRNARHVVKIEKVDSVPVRCIEVDSPSHLYLCGRGYIPTHNTTRAECLALWALLYAHRRFVVCIGATATASIELFKSLIGEIETNDLLAADFPEVCHPIRALDSQSIRAKGQHINGRATRIELSASGLVFPSVLHAETEQPYSTSGSVVRCVSITGRIRGMKHTVAYTGEVLRPDFVIIDDPQTDRSANSPRQVEARERAIQGSVLGLAGPQTDITAVMPCTVIRSDDLADRFLDREKRPEWQGVRTPMLESFPENMALWEEYAEIQANSFREGRGGVEATEFYKANRAAMDKGAKATWEERYNPRKELSAVQSAMNLYIRNPRSFAAEYQNAPLIESNESGKLACEAKELSTRLDKLEPRSIPRSTEFLTCGVDIQQNMIYYCITAWCADFGGSVVEYGTLPRQPVPYFTRSDPPKKLADAYPGLTIGPQVFRALEDLRDHVLAIPFKRDGSDVDGKGFDLIKPEYTLIDSNWNLTTDAVHEFCKLNESSFLPSIGKGIDESMLPMDSWSKKKGERIGAGWRVRNATIGTGRGRHCLYDTNYWKSRVAERLTAPLGAGNCLMLPGSRGVVHQLFIDHLCSEFSVPTSGRGRTVNKWQLYAKGQDNDYFDALVMSAVAASIRGLQLHDVTKTLAGSTSSTGAEPVEVVTVPRAKRERKYVDLSQLGKK